MLDRIDEATALLEQTRDIVRRLGHWVWIVSWHAAAATRWFGDPREAEHECRASYERLKALGEKSHFSSMSQGLAVALCEQGRYEEAADVINESREASRPNDIHSQIMWRSVLARVLASKGQFEEARRSAQDAIDFASTSDFIVGHADALLDQNEVLERAGDPEGAAAALEAAIRFYELKGNVRGAQLARSRLVLPTSAQPPAPRSAV
jgi:tetratricopeptide (TPR) repeat protein